MNKCFYSTDGITTIGPVTIEELKELHRCGKISDFALYAEEELHNPNVYVSWLTVLSLTGPSNRRAASDAPCATQLGILGQYLGALVAANATDPLKFQATWLVFVGADYFSLRPVTSKLPIHYPLSSILSLREWPVTVPYAIHRPVDHTLKQGTLSKLFTGKIQDVLGKNQDGKPEFAPAWLTTPFAIEIYHNVIYSSGGGVGVGVGVGVAIPIG